MNPRHNVLVAAAAIAAVVNADCAPDSSLPVAVRVVDELRPDEVAGKAEEVVPPKQAAPELIAVAISPEARVKATATPVQRELREGEWTEFRILIENAAGITAPLVIESDQLLNSEYDTARDRWLRLEIKPPGPLSGDMSETRILRLWSRDVGIRTAILNVNAGQGTQDLGFRGDVTLSFLIRSKTVLPTTPAGSVDGR